MKNKIIGLEELSNGYIVDVRSLAGDEYERFFYPTLDSALKFIITLWGEKPQQKPKVELTPEQQEQIKIAKSKVLEFKGKTNPATNKLYSIKEIQDELSKQNIKASYKLVLRTLQSKPKKEAKDGK